MADNENSGPAEGVRGVVENVKGKAKEAAGTVTGHDDLVEEGKAQQDKAETERDAERKEAEADSARAGAKSAEKREQSHQQSINVCGPADGWATSALARETASAVRLRR